MLRVLIQHGSLLLLAAMVGCASLGQRPPAANAPTAADESLGGGEAIENELQPTQGKPAPVDPGPLTLDVPRQTSSSVGPRRVRPVSHGVAIDPPVLSEDPPNAPHAPQQATQQPQLLPMDLTGALAMAAGGSPRIALAAARYREAYARLRGAKVLWLPSLRAGVSYNHHDGTLQASDGRVLDASRSSFQAGLGTRAVGAGTPAIHGIAAEFHASDAAFQPKITAHTASARNAAVEAARNDTLMQTALAYVDLLRAVQQLRIAEDTRDNAQRLADLTDSFARSGQGPRADADRTRTELVRRRNEVSRAQEGTRVATVRLSELLSLDPSTQVVPQEATIVPIDLVSQELALTELVSIGLSNRPELAEASHLVCEAVYRYRREKYAPLLPSVLLGVSQSDFGGGFGSDIRNYRARFDVDATVYWELRNFGFGEQAKRDETRSQYDQARAIKVAMLDRVAREILEAHAQVSSRRGQIAVAESGVEAATNSYQRNIARIREGQGLPIEVLQSLQALDDSRREYLRTLSDYNAAQFRLQRAVGWPVQ